MENNSLSLLMLTSAMGSLFLSLYTFKSRKNPAMLNLSLLLMAVTVWAFGYSLELAATNLQHMKIFNAFAYLGIATIPVLWLIFVARYSGNDGWLTPLNTALLFVVPLISIILVATNDLHYLFYSAYEMVHFGVFGFPRPEPGIFWWVHVTYSYLAIISGLWLLISLYFKVPRPNRFFVGMFIAGLLLPYIANIAYVSGFRPYGFLDITPIAFIVMGVMLAFGAFTKRAMDVSPLAYDLLFKNIPDVIFVIDTQGRIVNTNPAAQKLLDNELKCEAVGGDDSAKPLLSAQSLFALADASEIEVNERIYTVSNTPILSPGNKILGKLIVLHDITKRKKVVEELAEREALQQLLMTLATGLVNVPLNEVDAAINDMLGKIGLYSGLDRVYVFRHDYENRVTTNTHEWCAEGITPEIDNLQATPFEYFPDILEIHQKGEPVHFPSVANMPEEHPMRRIFEAQGISSLLLMPLMQKGKNIGFVGFDAVREEKEFTETEITLLSIFAELIVNIEERQKSEQVLRESEQRYREILQTTEEGFYEVDLTGNIIACNRSATKMLGFEEYEIIGMSYKSLFQDPSTVYREFNQAFKAKTPRFSVVVEAIRKDGSTITVDLSLSLIYDRQGNISGFRGMGRDITERVKLEQQLTHLSFHDQLTGAYNRRYYENELKRLSSSREHPITIISADIDSLKLVNDSFGHDEGDRYIQASAKLLKNTLRASDILARVGGDEFAIILPRMTREQGEQLLERVEHQVEEYNRKQTTRLPLSISIGLAVSESSEDPLEETYKKADRAMYTDRLQRSRKARNMIITLLLDSLHKRSDLSDGEREQVEEISLCMGRELKLDDNRMSDLKLLCRTYDLGKVCLPDHIVHCNLLHKSGELTEAEKEAIRRHPEAGYRIASASPELADIAELILKHHENFDGSGYPLGLKGEKIPIECRIVAIAISYTAMTNSRPYAKTLDRDEAIEELKRCSGAQFDPDLVKTFAAVMAGEDR